MKYTRPLKPSSSTKNAQGETNKKSFGKMEKKERWLSFGVYSLIIIITVSLMLIIFNLVLKV